MTTYKELPDRSGLVMAYVKDCNDVVGPPIFVRDCGWRDLNND